MPNKTPHVKPNTTQGGNKMKCSFCGTKINSLNKDQDVCDECAHSIDELSNGKGDDEDEDE